MALRIHPGIVIAAFLNLVLLMVVRSFIDLNTNSMTAPLIVLALVWPWVMVWIAVRAMAWFARESARRREEKERSDFV